MTADTNNSSFSWFFPMIPVPWAPRLREMVPTDIEALAPTAVA
jgi:hypothetical protein